MKCHILWHFIRVFNVCESIRLWVSDPLRVNGFETFIYILLYFRRRAATGMKKIMQLLLKLLITLKVVWGQTGDQAKSLREQLFITNNYDKKIRPVADQSQSIGRYRFIEFISETVQIPAQSI